MPPPPRRRPRRPTAAVRSGTTRRFGVRMGRRSFSGQAETLTNRHVYRTRSKPFVGDKAGSDATQGDSGSVKLIWSVRRGLRVIFSPFGGPMGHRFVRHPDPVRRTVNLDRHQLIALLGSVPDPTYAACQAEVSAGATFRVHDGTVSRESALRTYAARTPTADGHEAMRRLAMRSEERRVGKERRSRWS